MPNTGRGGGCHERSCRSLAAGVVPITWAAATSARAEHWPPGVVPITWAEFSENHVSTKKRGLAFSTLPKRGEIFVHYPIVGVDIRPYTPQN